MKTRLDRLMVDRGLAESREKAQALIMAGEVRLNGQKAAKPGHSVETDCTVEVLSREVDHLLHGLRVDDLVPERCELVLGLIP